MALAARMASAGSAVAGNETVPVPTHEADAPTGAAGEAAAVAAATAVAVAHHGPDTPHPTPAPGARPVVWQLGVPAAEDGAGPADEARASAPDRPTSDEPRPDAGTAADEPARASAAPPGHETTGVTAAAASSGTAPGESASEHAAPFAAARLTLAQMLIDGPGGSGPLDNEAERPAPTPAPAGPLPGATETAAQATASEAPDAQGVVQAMIRTALDDLDPITGIG